MDEMVKLQYRITSAIVWKTQFFIFGSNSATASFYLAKLFISQNLSFCKNKQRNSMVLHYITDNITF